MNEQGLRFRVGVFVLSAMILLAVLIMLFGSTPSLLRRHVEYKITFDEAPGVNTGTPVRRSGVRIGEVKRIQLDDVSGKVHVFVWIDKPHPLFETDQPVLVHGLLSGDSSIDFVTARKPDDLSEPVFAPPEKNFKGTSQADVATLLNQTSVIVPSAQDSLKEIQKTLQRYEKMAPLVEDTLKEYRDLARSARDAIPDVRRTNDEIQVAARNLGRLTERVDVLLQTNQDKVIKAVENFSDTVNRVGLVFNDENQRNLAAALKNVRVASENLDNIAKNTDDLVKESRATMKRFGETVAQADPILMNLQQATKPLAEQSAGIMQNIQQGTLRFNQIMGDMHDVLRGVNQGDGTFRRLMNDPSLYNNLNDAACMFARIMPRLDRILKDFEVFADKVARHPEALGIGGAVSPSSGLK